MQNPINQITTMRLPNGTEVAFVDWQDLPLFSTVDLLSGFTDTELSAFTYVVGDEVPATSNVTVRRTASENDTNLSTPGSMASTEEMLVYAIKPEIFEVTTSNANMTSADFTVGGQPTVQYNRLALLNYFLTLRLEVSQKAEHEASFGYHNAGFGVYALSTDSDKGINGMPTQDAVRSLVIPVHIGGQEKYRVTLRNGRGAAVPIGDSLATPPVENQNIALITRINLDGLYKRPVS